MAVNFPNNPVNGQTFTVGSTVYVYNYTKGYWDVNAASPTVDTQPQGGGVTAYTLLANLPVTADTGDLAYVTENQKIYLWNGTTWFHVLTAETPNTAPYITTGPDAGYQLAEDGTPLVITLNATDPQGTAITWNYTVTGGTLGNTATISVNNNQFTITPSTNPADAGAFELTFTASDGVNVANTSPAYFTLLFNYNFFSSTTVDSTIVNPVNPTNADSGINFSPLGSSTLRFGASMQYAKNNELIIGAPGNNDAGGIGGIFIYDTSVSPPSLTAWGGHSVSSSVARGANFALQFDTNDEFIVVAQNENGTSANGRPRYRRRVNGEWPASSSNKIMGFIDVPTTMNLANNHIVALDENSNTLAVSNAAQDDVEILEWSEAQGNWQSLGTISTAMYDAIDMDILDHYLITCRSSSTASVSMMVKDQDAGWQLNQFVTTTHQNKTYVKLFNYNGQYYFVLVGGGDTLDGAGTYRIEIFAIDEATKNVSVLYTAVGTQTQSSAATEVDVSGNLFNKNHVHAYLAGDEVNIMVAESLRNRIHYVVYNMASNSATTSQFLTMGGLTDNDATVPHSVAMDRYSGKFAVSNSTYNAATTDGGKVWIVR